MRGKAVAAFGLAALTTVAVSACGSGSFAVPKDKKLRTLLGQAAAPEKMGYATMSVPDICWLGVPQLAAADAHLYVWVTNSFMREGYDVAEA